MLVLIPIVWFSLLLAICISKKGFGVSAYVSLMYVITSIAALLLYSNTPKAERLDPSLISTIIYCFLISLSIIPIYRIDKTGYQNVQINNPGFIKGLIWFYLFCFFFLLVFYWQDIMFRIALGDWDDIKRSAAMGDAYSIRQFSGLLRPVSIIVRVFTSISFVMIPVFFLSLKQLRLPYRYSFSAIIGSLSSFLVAILDADRSRIFIWVLLMGLCLVIFWGELGKRMKRSIIPLIVSVIGVAVIYSYAVSVSRFSDTSGGALQSVIAYAGQPFSNFCYFFDHFNNLEGVNTRVLFPFTHTFIVGDYVGGVDLQMEMTLKTGIYSSVFYTFLGIFIIDSNQAGPFLFIIVYLLIWAIVQRRSKKRNRVSLYSFFVYYFLMVIPTYGCIAYMYSHWYLTLSIVLLLLSCRISGNSKLISTEQVL